MRDVALLQSALARPQQLQAYGDQVDLIALAPAYAAGISHNHPFIDGNKRSAFLMGALFLELNDARFTASEAATAEAMLALAAGQADEADYRGFLRENAVLP